MFGAGDYSDLGNLDPKEILKTAEEKAEYARILPLIDSYIKNYRSYAVYDRDYESPVHYSIYLDTSLTCGFKIEYLLAVARLESNFGTNRYNNDGSLNRIGRTKNLMSFGLNDSGDNKYLENWEDVFPMACRWYTSLENKGISDYKKWKFTILTEITLIRLNL
jgi:hypothetical protein